MPFPPAARHPVALVTLALSLVFAPAACRRTTPAARAAALAETIATLHHEFPADPTAEQADALEKPARRAEEARCALRALHEKYPQDPAITTALERAEPLGNAIGRSWRLAGERRDLAALLGGLKVRGYRATRSTLLPRLLEGLAAASRQAAETELEQLPALVREAASLAAELAAVQPATDPGSNRPITLSRADWLLAADRIDEFNRAEPPEFALGLGLAFAALGKNGFALVELERAERAAFENPEHAAFVPLARAVVFNRLGFTELAVCETAKISDTSEQGRQLLAFAHATLAYGYGQAKDWKQMDRELGLAVRAWPNNPLVVFLSGERLLADGRTEAALESFTRASAGTEGAWLAPLIEQRVRAVRDSHGTAPPLMLDNDFIVRCAVHLLIERARQTTSGRKLAALLESTQLLPASLGITAE